MTSMKQQLYNSFRHLDDCKNPKVQSKIELVLFSFELLFVFLSRILSLSKPAISHLSNFLKS